MRILTAATEIGPRVGPHYGQGQAVAFGARPDSVARYPVANWRPCAIPPGSTLLCDEVGTHLMVLEHEPPPPGGDDRC